MKSIHTVPENNAHLTKMSIHFVYTKKVIFRVHAFFSLGSRESFQPRSPPLPLLDEVPPVDELTFVLSRSCSISLVSSRSPGSERDWSSDLSPSCLPAPVSSLDFPSGFGACPGPRLIPPLPGTSPFWPSPFSPSPSPSWPG